MTYKLVFIDDSFKKGTNEPLVRSISKQQKDADITVFLNPEEGLNYVLNNLDSRMIVFLDCKFDGYPLQGINVLKKIRKQTSLLYIVMMSANSINQINQNEPSSIVDMINEDFIWFFDKNNNTFADASELIDKIRGLWDSRFDCVLEQWILRHPEDATKIAYQEAAGKSYTWSDVLKELRLQTPIGKSFEKRINQFYIYQLMKQNG